MKADDEEFGVARLRETLATHVEGGAQEILDAVAQAVDDFVAGAPQSDDLTVFVVKRMEIDSHHSIKVPASPAAIENFNQCLHEPAPHQLDRRHAKHRIG